MNVFAIDERFIQKNQQAINQGQAVEIQLRDNRDLTWRNVRAIISPDPLEDGETVEVLGLQGYTKSVWFVKILDDLGEAAINAEEGFQGF